MSDNTTDTPRAFYGRRKARPLRGVRASALEDVLPRIQITDAKAPAFFDFTPREQWLEIGFGNGDSLAAWHRAMPDVGFLGCEPFINGVSNLCKLIANDDVSNIRIINDVAQPLIEGLPDGALDRAYLLNPDPWPKKRHAKRRFIQPVMLDALARIIKPGGLFIATTDHAALAEWMFEHLQNHPAFESNAKSLDDCTTPPDGWLQTRYEGKGLAAGRVQRYLVFKRV